MKLCYLADPRSMHTRRWLEYFVNQGHDVHLISVFTEHPSFEGVRIHYVPPLPLIFMKRIRRGQAWLATLFSPWRIRRQIQRIEPDLVHAHYVAFYGWLAALSGFHPFVLTLWGGDILADQGAFKFPKGWLTPFALEKADLVTGVSERLLANARKYMKHNVETHVIRIGASLENFNPIGGSKLWRTRLELGNDPIVLSPRPFEPIYNIETIVAAIPYVLDQIPETRFVFKDETSRIRSDSYRVKILHKIDEMKIEKSVRYVGEVPYNEMASFYRLSDVVVSVPLSDGFPVTVLEAMACGTPIVMGHIPHLSDIIIDGQNALTVSPNDPVQLAKAIVHLLRDETLRRKMIATNLALVKKHGDFDVEMKKMEELYYGVI